MEKKELPNSTLILIFGILSVVGCCCYGIPGAIFGIITLVMAKKATEIYSANPELYTGFQNVKAGRILAIIGLVLLGLSFVAGIIGIMMLGGVDEVRQMQEEILREYGG